MLSRIWHLVWSFLKWHGFSYIPAVKEETLFWTLGVGLILLLHMCPWGTGKGDLHRMNSSLWNSTIEKSKKQLHIAHLGEPLIISSHLSLKMRGQHSSMFTLARNMPMLHNTTRTSKVKSTESQKCSLNDQKNYINIRKVVLIA